MIKKLVHNTEHAILLTGSTGLIGSYLLKVLLQHGYKVYALARRKDRNSAQDRVYDVLRFWDKDILSRNYDNLIILDGDVKKENLGLEKNAIEFLKHEVEEIFHCAAVTQFNCALEKIRRVNVDGTRNILELALKCQRKERLKKVNHISTVYVCGDYNGIFKENNLDVGQKFSTPYEKSKFEAEKLIDNYREKGLWIDVFRPPMVIGEALTGKTIALNQSFYQAMHFLSLGLLEYLPCYNMHFNVVYLDELCRSISCISSKTRTMNKNYHVFNSKKFSAEQFLDIFYNFLDIEKPVVIHPDNFIQDKMTPAMNMLLKHNFYFLNRKTTIDSVYTNKVLNKNGFIFSDLEEKKLYKVFEYALKKGVIKEFQYD